MASKIKNIIDPINLTGDPLRSMLIWDENCPNKIKNVNKQVIKVGDYVYFDGGEGKVEQLIQIGTGPDDYYLAVFKGGKIKLNAKGCYPTKFDRFLSNPSNGLMVSILIGILISLMFYIIITIESALKP